MKNTLKHTPGPWKYGNGGYVESKEFIICNPLLTCGQVPDSKEQKANALLIAAAPELLKACKAILCKDGNENINRIKEELFKSAPDIEMKLIKAIAKAEGR